MRIASLSTSAAIPTSLSESIVAHVNDIFPIAVPFVPDPADAIEVQIYKALIGTRTMRVRGFPGDDSAQRIQAKIRASVGQNMPISIMTLLGTAKSPDGTLSNEADLADFSGLLMFCALNNRVRTVYDPGICVQAYYEDAVGFWLFGATHAVETIQNRYASSLKAMNGAIKTPVVIVREPAILDAIGSSTIEFLDRCELVHKLFQAYFEDSEAVLARSLQAIPYDSWEDARKSLGPAYQEFWDKFAEEFLAALPSYKALAAVGWNGFIPPEMRAFYKRRFATNAKGVGQSDEELVTYMARYFCSTLVKAQLRSPYKTVAENPLYDGKNAIKVTLLPLAPGIPEAFRDTIELRPIPKKGGVDTCVAPWRAEGGILVRSDGTIRVRIDPVLRPESGDRVPAYLVLDNGHSVKSDIILRRE